MWDEFPLSLPSSHEEHYGGLSTRRMEKIHVPKVEVGDWLYVMGEKWRVRTVSGAERNSVSRTVHVFVNGGLQGEVEVIGRNESGGVLE